MLTILAIGEDADLLKTRSEILRTMGANVMCVRGVNALSFIKKWEFDLIVICHTVSEALAEQVTEFAHAKGSKTLVLLVLSDAVHSKEYVDMQVDARTMSDPQSVLRFTKHLLTRRASAGPLPRHSVQQSSNTIKRLNKPSNYPADIAIRQQSQMK